MVGMAEPRATTTLDTKVTEQFLLSQPEILDASVWFDDGQMIAHVTIHDKTGWDELRLGHACVQTIGTQLTPSRFVLIQPPVRPKRVG